MAYSIDRFGSLLLPDLNTRFALDTVQGKNTMVRTIAGGFDTRGAEQADLDLPQQIRFRGVILEDSLGEWRDAVDALRGLSRTRAKLWRTAWDNGEGHSCVARFMSGQVERDFQTARIYETTIQFLQLSPWVGHNHRHWTLDDGYFLDDLLYLDDAGYTVTLNASPKATVVTNDGNRAVSDIRLTFTAGSAAITALTVTCGEAEFSFSGTVAAGKDLVIDAGAQSVINNGAAAYANFSLTSNHVIEDWLRFAPGANTLTVTFTGGSTNSTLQIEFEDGWE